MKSHHILILKKTIESRYAKLLLHILVTQLIPRMRISLSYGTRSNDWIFSAIITWRKHYLFVTTILLLFSISTDAFCSHQQTFHIPCYTRRFKDYRILQCARSLNLMRAKVHLSYGWSIKHDTHVLIMNGWSTNLEEEGVDVQVF